MNKHALTAWILMFLMLGLIAFQPAAANANSADDWPMFHHDPAHTGYISTEPLTVSPVVVWAQGPEFAGFPGASPAVVGGIVYASSTNLYAFNASTGNQIWSVGQGGDGESPIVTGGYVYCGGVAYNASTGAELWSPNPPTYHASQAFANGYLYTFGYDSNGTHVDSFLGLNATTGALLWCIPVNFTGPDPAIDGGVLYVSASDGNLYAFNSTNGVKLWNSTIGYPYLSGGIPTAINGRVYVGSFDDNVYCLNALDGAKIWNYTTGGFVESSPAIADGTVYIGSNDGNVYALNALSGELVWKYSTNYTYGGRGVVSSPAVAGGVVYVGSYDGELYALNASDGHKLWSYAVQNPPSSDNDFNGLSCSPGVVNGRVYIGSSDHIMTVLASPSAAPSSAVPELPTWTILPFLIAATIAAFAYTIKKRCKQAFK